MPWGVHRRSLPVLLALLCLSGCGSGPSTETGRVSDATGRLCLQEHADQGGDCFSATPQQLSPLRVGSCVRVTYRTTTGRRPPVDDVVTVAPPCFS